MFELLGTPAADKVLRIYDVDHTLPRSEFIRESLAWLDRYLGPVLPAPGTRTVSTTPTAPR